MASSWEQYAPVAAALVDPLPEGLIVHVAGRTDEGVRIIDVWESEEAWLLFRAERLAPAIAALDGPARREPTFRDLYPEHVVLRNRGAAAARRGQGGTMRKVGLAPVFVVGAVSLAATLAVTTDAAASPSDAMQAAKAATARYHRVEQALKDGYSGLGESAAPRWGFTTSTAP